ncbi:hypothetical protein LEN26_001372 [Aphanomyces euteiches]|nr:hypothetical protein AeMF1_003052 [Aphanomyces euteiches]KAH9161517.1 hypothetical protein LEN26_001372 [Aphanomyces euteiches]KAH9191003.1 hypothetical protein AeNC1_007028 [Aphanomyces euteiches]
MSTGSITLDSPIEGAPMMRAPHQDLGTAMNTRFQTLTHDPKTDMVILDGEPMHEFHPRHDEWFTWLWFVEGKWYKVLYLNVWGLLLAVVLGTLLAFVIEKCTSMDIDVNSNNTTYILEVVQDFTKNTRVRDNWSTWLRVPGDLFIRALQCIVVPFIFCAIMGGIGDLAKTQKAFGVCVRFFIYSIITATAAASLGVLLATSMPDQWFQPTIVLQSPPPPTTPAMAQPMVMPTSVYNMMQMTCPNKDLYLGLNQTTNLLQCMPSPKEMNFSLPTMTSSPPSTTTTKISSAVDEFYTFVLNFVPNSLMGSFQRSDGFLSISMIAIAMGVAMHLTDAAVAHSLVLELNKICLYMIGYIVKCAPVAVMFLVASSLLQAKIPDPSDTATSSSAISIDATDSAAVVQLYQWVLPLLRARSVSIFENLGHEAKLMGVLFVLFLIGLAVHSLIVLPLLVFLTVRRNPFEHVKTFSKAIGYGFGTGSSLVALPSLIQAAGASRVASRELSCTILSVGSAMHLDGAAFYFSTTLIFLMRTSGIALTNRNIAAVLVGSVVNSWSCPPLPHAGILVMMTLSINVVAPDLSLYLVWVVAMDVVMDRFSTVMSIWSNILILRVIASQTERETPEHGERSEAISDLEVFDDADVDYQYR